MFVLVSGGSCSGKSAYAESRVTELAREKKAGGLYYFATMQVYDEESVKRVKRHRAMRAGKGFETVECPTDVIRAFENFLKENGAVGEGETIFQNQQPVVLLECLSNLVANEMFRGSNMVPEDTVVDKVTGELEELRKICRHLVIVTNNIFEDGNTYDEWTLAYIRALGRINTYLGRNADEMTEVVCGIPVQVR